MILIEKGKENKIRLKLNEGFTLNHTGGFIFEFINNTSDQTTKIHSVDASAFPLAYNLFILTDPSELDLEAAEYTLKVYASEAVETTTEGKEMIHTDFVKVYTDGSGSNEFIYSPE